MSIPLSLSCQIDTTKVTVPASLIRNLSRELAELDGMKRKFEAQNMIIKGYKIDLKSCEDKELLTRATIDECESLNIVKDDIIINQGDKLRKAKNQRNILGGVGLVLLIIVLI